VEEHMHPFKAGRTLLLERFDYKLDSDQAH
jgi:hypothetical protein